MYVMYLYIHIEINNRQRIRQSPHVCLVEICAGMYSLNLTFSLSFFCSLCSAVSDVCAYITLSRIKTILDATIAYLCAKSHRQRILLQTTYKELKELWRVAWTLLLRKPNIKVQWHNNALERLFSCNRSYY